MPKLPARLRPKRPDSARLARPRRIFIEHGGSSRAVRGEPLDLRSAAGKAYVAYRAEYRAHLGGEGLSAVEADLADMAARLKVLANVAYAGRLFDRSGNPRPAFDAFMRAARDLRAVFELLGLKRRTKEPGVDEYLSGAPA